METIQEGSQEVYIEDKDDFVSNVSPDIPDDSQMLGNFQTL